ncbi:MAG: hypothetical protein ACE5GQ_06695 [Nitrospinales bacterium]
MTATFVKEIECFLCKAPFSPALAPEDGANGYTIHCASPTCTNKIFLSSADPVRVSFREVLGLGVEALALAMQETLAKCPCGSKFSHDSGKRCPSCIKKIGFQKVDLQADQPFPFIWNLDELKKMEPKLIEFIMRKVESKEETFQELVDRYESGAIGPEEYMEGIDALQRRESLQLCVIKTWAMCQGRDKAFRAAEELELVERYGTRILITIASGLKISTGLSLTNILTKEADNWDGLVHKELKTYLGKISGQ